jgi:hypothetical protein
MRKYRLLIYDTPYFPFFVDNYTLGRGNSAYLPRIGHDRFARSTVIRTATAIGRWNIQ